jgi:hypothetical protein
MSHHREGRRRRLHLLQTFADGLGGPHLEAACFHGARQPLQERLVVLHDQQRALGLGDLVRISIIARFIRCPI